MANSITWDPGTFAFKVEMDPPGVIGGPTMVTNTQISATAVTAQVKNRVYSSYIGPPVNGQGGGFTWWQLQPNGGSGPLGSPDWNVPGPAYGGSTLQFYIQPTYQQASGGGWKTFTNPPILIGPNTYKFNDPSGGGSSSIIITMAESGGGGPDM